MDLVVPDLGAVEEVTLLRWLKGEGEEVEAGEAVAEVETDKAVFVIEAPASGIVRHLASVGAKVRPGDPIALVLSS